MRKEGHLVVLWGDFYRVGSLSELTGLLTKHILGVWVGTGKTRSLTSTLLLDFISSMVFDPASAPHLKPWLVRTLEPMFVCLMCLFPYILTHSFSSCDAEPGALADYILALLRHNVPESEMRTELAAQLDEFLEKGQSPLG